MKYFIIEDTLINPDLISDDVMKDHINYSKRAMDEGLILLSGLKSDMNGGLFIMKQESIEEVHNYLSSEPFKINGIQEYKVMEFSPHFINEPLDKWVENKAE